MTLFNKLEDLRNDLIAANFSCAELNDVDPSNRELSILVNDATIDDVVSEITISQNLSLVILSGTLESSLSKTDRLISFFQGRCDCFITSIGAIEILQDKLSNNRTIELTLTSEA